MSSASCEKNPYSCSSPSMMYSRSVASYFKVLLVRSDIVNQYNMVLCTIWCCVQYGVVYNMVLCVCDHVLKAT